MTVLDTNVIIEFVRGESRLKAWMNSRRDEGMRFSLSILSVVELLSYKDTPFKELVALERWLRFWRILDIDLSIARRAAELRTDYGLKTVDSVIAATAIVNQCPLVSRDRAFRKINELELIVP